MLMGSSKNYLEALCYSSSATVSLSLFLISSLMFQERSLYAVKDFLHTSPNLNIDGLQQMYTTGLWTTNSIADIAVLLAALLSLKRLDTRQYPSSNLTRIEHPLVSLCQLLKGSASQWRPLSEYHVLVVRKVAGYCNGFEGITNLLNHLGSSDEKEWREVNSRITSVECYWFARLSLSMDHESAQNAAYNSGAV